MDETFEPPAKIETVFERAGSNRFSSINSPTAGARNENPLPKGDSPFQLYSLATPNGQKVGILLEELGLSYDAHVINIGQGTQFSKGFVDINPNSKIPCGVDHAPGDGGEPVALWESGGIMTYLAEKHGRFIPKDPRKRAECMNWVMWQMAGQGPMTGNFGHFMVYAPPDQVGARTYGVARYGMEVQRLCSVLDQHLEGKKFMCGDEYTIADMICMPWFEIIRTVGYTHTNGVSSREFLSTSQYLNCQRWADSLMARPQVQRGMLVCRGKPKPWLSDSRFKHLAKM